MSVQMTETLIDPHAQFASFFASKDLQPYIYLLSKKMAEGNICLSFSDMINDSGENPFGNTKHPELISKANEFVSMNETDKKPFVICEEHLYTQRYFNYETIIKNTIFSMLEREKEQYEKRKIALDNLRQIITSLAEKKIEENKDDPDWNTDWQLIAAINASLNTFTIITGGPGTGKTTTVAKLLFLLLHQDNSIRIALAAPTGKAAARMGDSLKKTNLDFPDEIKKTILDIVPSTVHRLLGSKPDEIYFKHNQKNPLPYDVVIVDESSMLDVALFAKLLQAIGPETRLILLGDKNQLASVEAGSLFGDLCKQPDSVNLFSKERFDMITGYILSNDHQIRSVHSTERPGVLANHIIELRKSHRFGGDSAIGNFSRAIIQNNESVIRYFTDENKDDTVIIDKQKEDHLFNELVLRYREFIEESDTAEALKKLNRFRVLCAVRNGPDGIYTINQKIENVLKDAGIKNHDGSDFSPSGNIYVNRPVMVTQNNAPLKLYNGDIGIMRKDAQGRIVVWFEDKEKKIRPVPPVQIPELETVFAMTIHKSQGSEFPHLLIMIPDKKENRLLTRELLYTAITRASTALVLMSKEEIIYQASSEQVKRISGLNGRLQTNKQTA